MSRAGIRRKIKQRSRTSCAALEALESRRLLSVSLLKDINTQQWSYSGTWTYGANGNTAYISQNDGVHGLELWRSDGTLAGTYQLKDINPGGAPSQPQDFAKVGTTEFFTADDGPHGRELWKTDGTAAGTVLVKDINPGVTSSNPMSLVNVSGKLFFTANDGINGQEVWVSDGTANGTVMVKDINPGSGDGINPSSAVASSLIAGNGVLIFAANDNVHGSELWRSDGTAGGTTMISDIATGSVSSTPVPYANINGIVYFTANPNTSRGIWKTDGTVAGTTAVVPGSEPYNIVASGNYLYFDGGLTSDAGFWRTDGTSNGTIRLSSSSQYGVDVNGTLYFGSSGTLYRTDGTTVTTVKSGFTSVGVVGNDNGTAILSADDGSGTGAELWKSNGTAATTSLVKDINPGAATSSPQSLIALGNTGKFLFLATTPATGLAWYVSDATPAGTQLLEDIFPGTDGAAPFQFVPFSGQLYFAATDGLTGTSGAELFKTDGTAAGTALVDDIYPGPNAGSPNDLTVFQGKLYFQANDGTHGTELWESDGTAAGTYMLADIYPGASSSAPGSESTGMVVSGNYLYFSATDPTTGTELWRTDGTAAGTIRLADTTAGSGSGNPTNLTDVGGKLFFDSTTNFQTSLWISDGTPAGTVLLRSDVVTGSSVNFAGALYFAGTSSSSNTGTELWKSDGTAAGTVLVDDIYVGFNSSSPANLTVVNGSLFFTATDATHGTELWRSDGTAAGTVLVKDISQSSASSSPSSLTNVNGVLYFIADDGTHGKELWRSDGTAAGTYLVTEIVPGPTGGGIKNLAAVNGFLYFAADDGNTYGYHGIEPWRSDGTAAGTVMLGDIHPGPSDTGGHTPFLFNGMNNSVLFSDDDGVHNRELFQADPPTFATLSGNVLTLTGTANNDAFGISSSGGSLQVNLNGLTANFAVTGVSSIVINGVSGSDTVNINSALSADVQVTGATTQYLLSANAGAITLHTDVGATTAATSVQVAAGASIQFETDEHLFNLSILGGSATVDPAAVAKTLTISSVLNITNSGVLDIAKAHLLVNSTQLPAATLSPYLHAAYDNGKWDGTGGIMSSTAATAPAPSALSLGYATSTEGTHATIPAGMTLIELTSPGDADLSSKSDFNDFLSMQNNFNKPGDWSQGDFDYNGVVDFNDFLILQTISTTRQSSPLPRPRKRSRC